MDLSLSSELAGIPDLRHQVRSLHCFRSCFHRGADLVASHLSAQVEVDQLRIASAFHDWLRELTFQKHYASLDRRDFSIFSCGLVLADLIRVAPVKFSWLPRTLHGQALTIQALEVAEFWPEGFLLTSYCTSVLQAVLQQDFNTRIAFTPAASEIRTWSSFRENAQEDPSLAIGFLDLFLGEEPNWEQPEAAFARPAMRRAARNRHQTHLVQR